MEDMIVALLIARAVAAVYENDYDNYQKCGRALVILTDSTPHEVAQAISEALVSSRDDVEDSAALIESVMADIESL